MSAQWSSSEACIGGVKKAKMNPFNAPFVPSTFKTGFKPGFNDFYGEKIGDKTLVQLSNNILDAAYALGYKVYRNHADEFSGKSSCMERRKG